MKTLLAAALTALFAAAAPGASPTAGESQTKPEAKSEPTKESVSAAAIIPKSVFESSTLYKDPFHPRSTRRVKVDTSNKNDPPPPDVQLASFLVLNGLSGPANQRLAMINGRTIAAGEETEVATERGKVKIRCLEIRTNTVLVLVVTDGAKIELRLKE